MKKVGVITMFGDYENFGNRLQNYAVQEVLRKHNLDSETFIYVPKGKDDIIDYNIDRLEAFKRFNDRIKYYHTKLYAESHPEKGFADDLDYLLIGSDQMWNYTFERYFSPRVFADFSDKHRKVTLSVSIGIDKVPDKGTEEYEAFDEHLKKIDYLSVREDSAKRIVKEISGRDDVTVLIDPTMMLKKEDWEAVMSKPKNLKTDKYILKAFLGQVSKEKEEELARIAKENDCEIIDIIDENSTHFGCGPEEFIYLEKNAFLVVTDSFHSCVFAILFGTPFVVFERDDKKLKSMYSRIETLLNTFDLNYRVFDNEIDNRCLSREYSHIEEILKKKREEADEFIEKAFGE